MDRNIFRILKGLNKTSIRNQRLILQGILLKENVEIVLISFHTNNALL